MPYENDELKRLDNKVRYLQNCVSFAGLAEKKKDQRDLTEEEKSEGRVNGRILTTMEQTQGKLLVKKRFDADEMKEHRKQLGIAMAQKEKLHKMLSMARQPHLTLSEC